MADQIVPLVTILFLLSMVCERVADFLKHYLCGSKLFMIKDTLTRNPANDLEEKERQYRIMKINVCSGILIAAIIKADMVMIFYCMDKPGECLGWANFAVYYTTVQDKLFLVPGIILTGCFISFGSKFWHDILDIVCEIKNAKRISADPETYKIDNVRDLERTVEIYQSSFIQAAYQQATPIYMAKPNVKGISIRKNDEGYYFELTLSETDPTVEPYYVYQSNNGLYHSITVKTAVLGMGDLIVPHGINLSSKIFDINMDQKWGTLGVLVKTLEGNPEKRYLLTCCHNVIFPLSNLPYSTASGRIVNVATTENKNTIEIGKVSKAIRDREVDAALIELSDDVAAKISKYIPQTGTPLSARQLTNDDKNKVTAYMYGAKTGPISGRSQGTVISVYNTIKITYSSTDEFEIINTIAISNNGKAISQEGDSGACVVDGKYNILGIVVAGSSEVTYVLPIHTLLSKFGVQLT